MNRCLGQCKRPYTRDFTSETHVGTFGWVFILHDTIECPDRVAWRMDSLRRKALELRQERG